MSESSYLYIIPFLSNFIKLVVIYDNFKITSKGGISMKRLGRNSVALLTSKTKMEIVIYSICILVGIVTGIWEFAAVDTTPATSADYEPLEAQAYEISQNPDLLFKTECKAEITNGETTLTLKNDECTLVTKYNSDFQVVETTKKDNSFPIIVAIIISIIFGACFGFAAFLAILLLLLIWAGILTIYHHIETKRKK